jgi:hypothetical protein
MSDVHQQILEKLAGESQEVRRLATKALDLAGSNSESAVFEALKNWVREIVKSKGDAP